MTNYQFFNSIQLLLHNPTLIYRVNSPINGAVVIHPHSSKVAKITVKLVGKASVKFVMGEMRYISKDEFIVHEQTLWQPENGKPEKLNGIQTFPFGFTIPENSAPTFLFKYGRISYKITAEMKVPWSLEGISKKTKLVIIPAHIDLTMSPEFGSPKEVTKKMGDFEGTVSSQLLNFPCFRWSPAPRRSTDCRARCSSRCH